MYTPENNTMWYLYCTNFRSTIQILDRASIIYCTHLVSYNQHFRYM